MFAYTLVDNVIERPDGVIIAAFFITIIMLLSGLSRAWRSIELRVTELHFSDASSLEHWHALCGKKVHLVPLRTNSRRARSRKTEEVRRHYAIEGPIAFIHVNLLDNRSEFMSPLEVRVTREEGNYVLVVSGAIAIANSIAYVISRRFQRVPIFEVLSHQDGVDLPSMEEAREAQAVAVYARTVLTSFQDVENALVAYNQERIPYLRRTC